MVLWSLLYTPSLVKADFSQLIFLQERATGHHALFVFFSISVTPGLLILLCFQYQRFGGHFKTVIWVSCFSKRCYQQAQLIMTELRATRQKVNGNLFEGCCGLTDEPALYGLLRRMALGQLSKEEFAKEGAREKVCFVFFQPRHNKLFSASSVLG